MRLESVLAATGGRLLNHPFLTRFEGMALRPAQVERGALFLAFSPQTVPEALARGAYGVISDQQIEILDEEIAWIRVDDLERALLYLMRLWMSEHPRRFVRLSSLQADYLACFEPLKGAVVVKGDERQMVERVLKSAEEETLYCANKSFLDRIGALYEEAKPKRAGYRLLKSRLFRCDAVIEGNYFADLPVPVCTLDALAEVFALLRERGERFDAARLRFPESFEPLFLDEKGSPAPFGATQRAVVFMADTLPCVCLESLRKASWLSRRIFLPSGLKFGCDIKLPVYRYESIEALKTSIRHMWPEAGYYLIVGMRRAEWEKCFPNGLNVKPYQIKGLF